MLMLVAEKSALQLSKEKSELMLAEKSLALGYYMLMLAAELSKEKSLALGYYMLMLAAEQREESCSRLLHADACS